MSHTLLIDCNNFFVSCERVFRPELRDKPVAVMSSNDGCIVARSNEVKALGIPMGVPVFQVRDILHRHQVTLFSSNFSLYSDMSERVMAIVARYGDDVDVYSVDEAFVTFSDRVGSPEHLEATARTLRAEILRCVGIPVSIGIAPTKTLAKVASEHAKKGSGVVSLCSEEARHEALAEYPIGEVWNIGRAHTRRLHGVGVATAGAFCRLPTSWIERRMGVPGLRTYYELSGLACFGEMGAPRVRKSIMRSRSFGEPTTSFPAVYTALAGHVADATAQMRAQGSCASQVQVLLICKERGESLRAVYSQEHTLVTFSDDTRIILKAAERSLRGLWRPGLRCIKTGVLLSRLGPRPVALQPSLFAGQTTPDAGSVVFSCVDALNDRFGKGTVRLAAEPLRTREYRTAVKHDRISPAYTTSWGDILRVE